MSSVDDRIVNMKFNNTQFTQGAADSQKALTSLETTLTKTGQSKGITTLGAGVDGVKAKFSALQVAGAAALATIVSKATSAGLNLVKSLTLDPIMQGFSEYQTNLNSIQTVMSNTGENVNTVNGYMQKLNAYSDQTIYNFSEMAKNIGTFTAAGVDLETATSSIQGIANLAALSGSSSQQASTAMYQLSQAISAGRVGLQDWNSVVNAGMGGKQFQTALANTAVAMGDISKSSIGLEGPMERLTINGESFRQSISAAGGAASWLNSDVLVNTLASLDGRFSSVQLGLQGFEGAALDAELAQNRLNLEQQLGVKYSDEQFKALLKTADAAYQAATVVKTFPQLLQVVRESIGSIFANSFSIVLGNFNQSKKLWTQVGKQIVGPTGFITKMGTSWTTMLKSWVDAGGRTQVIKGFSRLFRSLGKIMGALKGAFGEIFQGDAAKTLSKISKGFNQFTKNLMVHRATVENLQKIFAGLFAIFHIGFTIISSIAKAIFAFFGAFSSGVDSTQSGLVSFLAGIAEIIVAFDKWLTKGDQLTKVMVKAGETAGAFIEPFVTGIGMAVQALGSLVSGGGLQSFSELFSKIQITIEAFQSSTEAGKVALEALFGVSPGAVDAIIAKFEALKDSLGSLSESGPKISAFFQNFGKNAGSVAASVSEIGTSIITGIVQGLIAAAPQILSVIGQVATGIIEGFKSALGIHSPSTEMVPVGIGISAGIGQGIGEGIASIIEVIGKAAGFIKDAFVQMFGGMDALDVAALLNAIFSGGLIIALTNFTKTLSAGAGGKNAIFGAIIGTFQELGNTLKTFQQGIKAKALLDIAIAVGVLVASIVILSFIKPEKIAISLGAIATMMGLLVGSMALLGKVSTETNMVVLAASMTLISVAMLNLAAAVAIFGNMDMKTLGKGFGALALGMGLMVAAMFALSKIKGSVEGMAASILVLSIAMNVMATAVLALGSMSMETLAKGLGAMAIGLALMVGSLLVLDKLKNLPAGAGSILVLAGAMVVLSVAVAAFGNMDMGTLAKGFGAIAIGLGLFIGAMYALAPIVLQVGLLASSILVFAAAMLILATAVGIMGSMDAETLAKGFAGMAVGLALLLGAAALATYVAPGLAILAGVFLSLGIAMGLAGAGMFLFATGFALLTATGIVGIAIISAAIEAFLALLPTIAIQAAAAFVAFFDAIARAAPKIGESFSKIFDAMIDVVIRAIPKIGELFQQLITTGISILRNSIPQWLDMGMTIISRFIEGLMKRVPEIAESALAMVQKFLDVIENHLGNIIDRGTDIVVALIKGLGKAGERIVKATGETIISFMEAIDTAVQQHSDDFARIGGDIAGHLLSGLASGFTQSKVGGIIAGATPIGLLNQALGGRMSGKKVNPFNAAQAAVSAGQTAANMVGTSNDPDAIKAAQAADKAQKKADAKAANALILQKLANDLAKKANEKGAGKGIKKKAEEAQRVADKAAANAEAAQTAADRQAEAAQRALDFSQAELEGKGDILSDQASEQSDQAAALFQRSLAEKKKAEELMKSKNAKERKQGEQLMAIAEKHAKAAEDLAKKAQQNAKDAAGFYEQAVKDRIKALEDETAAEEKAKKDAKEFDAADDAGKAAILQKRAEADELEAAKQKAEAARLIELAKSLAATDPEGAMKALDAAEEAAAAAKEAADRAEQEKEEAERLLNQPGTSSGGSSSGGIQPSKSVLEDAAKAVDRYTTSLMQAQQLAGGTEQVVQYNQNIYSPAALSPAEVYRNTRNLVSASAVTKAPPGGQPI